MKKVVVVDKVREIIIEDIKDDHIIGILWSSGSKNFLIRSDDKEYCTTTVNNGIYSNTIKEKSKKELLKRFLSKNVLSLEIFVFDTERELYKWLSE